MYCFVIVNYVPGDFFVGKTKNQHCIPVTFDPSGSTAFKNAMIVKY